MARLVAFKTKLGKEVRFIQKAIKQPGALSRSLGIPIEENIPPALLQRIRTAPVGTTIDNPSPRGSRRIFVDRTLKRRAVLAMTLKQFQFKKRT